MSGVEGGNIKGGVILKKLRKTKTNISLFLSLSVFFLSSFFILSSASSETVRYNFDSATSKIIFKGKSTLHSFEGEATEISGFAQGDTENIDRNPKGNFQVKVKSMKCEKEKMTANMLEDMEADKYPTIDFELQDVSILKQPDESNKYYLVSISGKLTIHGVTKEITFPADVEITEKDFNLHANVPLSLKDFNIKPSSFLFFLRVKDRIDLEIHIHGLRENV
ncbi:MAG: YceI family protein [Candidatus Schekmanbacteria bacterium]|nr:MAG: YceI family protein [Candidatus Schekmanbacteria bacterium]